MIEVSWCYTKKIFSELQNENIFLVFQALKQKHLTTFCTNVFSYDNLLELGSWNARTTDTFDPMLLFVVWTNHKIADQLKIVSVLWLVEIVVNGQIFFVALAFRQTVVRKCDQAKTRCFCFTPPRPSEISEKNWSHFWYPIYDMKLC